MTKVVEGGWWEGVCNGRVGWFPGNYVEEVPAGTRKNLQLIQSFCGIMLNCFLSPSPLSLSSEVLASLNPTPDKRSSLLQFYDMVRRFGSKHFGLYTCCNRTLFFWHHQVINDIVESERTYTNDLQVRGNERCEGRRGREREGERERGRGRENESKEGERKRVLTMCKLPCRLFSLFT